MRLNMLKAKIHRATVTGCDLEYEGSISIDTDLLKASGILPFEQVDIYNINNGARLTTYAIEGKQGTGEVALNGAAARMAALGDKVIICAYCSIPEDQVRNFNPTVVLMDDDNKIKGLS